MIRQPASFEKGDHYETREQPWILDMSHVWCQCQWRDSGGFICDLCDLFSVRWSTLFQLGVLKLKVSVATHMGLGPAFGGVGSWYRSPKRHGQNLVYPPGKKITYPLAFGKQLSRWFSGFPQGGRWFFVPWRVFFFQTSNLLNLSFFCCAVVSDHSIHSFCSGKPVRWEKTSKLWSNRKASPCLSRWVTTVTTRIWLKRMPF